jgi:hypothetical protein
MFKRSFLLATASDANGDVKLWDLRRIDRPLCAIPAELAPGQSPPPLNVVPLGCTMPGHAGRGVLQLCEDPSGVPADDIASASPEAPCRVAPVAWCAQHALL